MIARAGIVLGVLVLLLIGAVLIVAFGWVFVLMGRR